MDLFHKNSGQVLNDDALVLEGKDKKTEELVFQSVFK